MLSSDTSPNDVYVVDLGATTQRATDEGAESGDQGIAIWSPRRSFATRASTDSRYRRSSIARTTHRPPARRRRWCGCTAVRADRAARVTLRRFSTSSITATPCSPPTIAAHPGYGKTFFHLDDKHHGDVDLKDIVYGKNYLASLDWVDAERIGIIGGSYGGYMVGAALAFEPEAFDVGVNIFGVMNWVRTLTSIPPWWESFKESLYDEMGDPATDGERHRKISPLFHAKNIRVPLLVVQGANDPRVLQVESDEIVAAVRANGVPVEYVLFPDEGHGFTKRDNRIKASDAYVTFLDTNLKERAAGEAGKRGVKATRRFSTGHAGSQRAVASSEC